MTHSSGIVLRKPGDQIVCNARVVVLPDEALEDVDMFHDWPSTEL